MKTKTAWYAYWAVVAASFAAAGTMLAAYTPVEVTMGPIQKVFYLHLPVAINAFVACTVAFVGGVGYLWQRRMVWDDLSAAGAKVAALLCTVVLVTGVIWGRVAWGRWWTWSPRLTFSLLLWMLYMVYLIIRPSIESPPKRAMVSAVYAVAAFLDVPMVWLSVRLMPDIHPTSVAMIPAMEVTLAVWFVPVTLMTAGLILGLRGAARRRRAMGSEHERGAGWETPSSSGGQARAGFTRL